MSTDKPKAEWTDIKDQIKLKWSKFGDIEIEAFKGNLDLITEKIQKAYGYTKDKAEQEYKDFKTSLEPAVVKATDKSKPN